jgi:hypothetical protein
LPLVQEIRRNQLPWLLVYVPIVCGTASENAMSYAKFYSRSHHAVIRVYDEANNPIETHEQAV